MERITRLKKKILTLGKVSINVMDWKNNNLTIGFTNGCFDILHKGHISYLAQAKDLVDKLVVGLNSDDSVKKMNKSMARPLQSEDSRAFVLAALEVIDAVVIFKQETPLTLIKEILPDVLIKGGDYDIDITNESDKKYIVGSKEVCDNGGKVKTIPLVEGFSTTLIEKKILDR